MSWLSAISAAAAVAAFAYVPQRPLAVGVGVILALLAAVLTAIQLRRDHETRDRTPNDAAERAQLRWRSEGWDILGREIQEHRRYDRKLAACRLRAVDILGAGGPDQLAAALWPHLRVGSSVYGDGDGVVLLLPTTDRTASLLVLSRLQDALSLDGLADAAVIAVFPDDALTAGALTELLGDSHIPQPAALGTDYAVALPGSTHAPIGDGGLRSVS